MSVNAYVGLSLFIIRQAKVYLVVCVLTRITLQYRKTLLYVVNLIGVDKRIPMILLVDGELWAR